MPDVELRRILRLVTARSAFSTSLTIRRLYVYLISAIGLAMAAIGAAGAIGVLGSQAMGMNTHERSETATYLALVVVGGAAWASHWRTAVARAESNGRGDWADALAASEARLMATAKAKVCFIADSRKNFNRLRGSGRVASQAARWSITVS